MYAQRLRVSRIQLKDAKELLRAGSVVQCTPRVEESGSRAGSGEWRVAL